MIRSSCTGGNEAGAPAPREGNPCGRKRRILLFGWLPPPVFGPSVAYQTLMCSEFARHFDVTFINLSVVSNIRELEVVRISKLLKLAGFFLHELCCLLTRRFDFCCYPIAYNRNAFLKDSVLIGLARAFRVPVVLWSHGSGASRFRDSLSPKLQRRFDTNVRGAALVLVLAECLRSDFEAVVSPQRIKVVPIGIEPQPGLPPPDRGRTGLRILYLGGLARTKGIFDLFAAMPLVLAHRPDAKLLMAGEWFRATEKAEGEQFLQDHGLCQAVQFLGAVYGEAKWRTLASASLLVFPPPAQLEAFGIVLLEAMQSGLPIVATRGGARSEILTDGVNGLLAEELNPSDLAGKILHLANDPELRERMGRANKERFERYYTHGHFGKRMIAVFDEFATESSPQ
ncbi:MAG: glycosyltransferase family 4 protein [Verrucomicrobiia bacterium]